MRRFTIYYPKDHPDPKLAGKRYKPPKGCMLVVNEDGKPFTISGLNDWYIGVQPLLKTLPKFDIVWNDTEAPPKPYKLERGDKGTWILSRTDGTKDSCIGTYEGPLKETLLALKNVGVEYEQIEIIHK